MLRVLKNNHDHPNCRIHTVQLATTKGYVRPTASAHVHWES